MSIIALLITIVIWALIFYVLFWGLGKIGLPEPFAKVALVILVLAAVVVVISILTGGIAPFGFISNIK